MLQPVLLASRRSCHGEGPWYLQKGDHHYRFVLASHRPGEGRQFGASANAPLSAVFDPPKQPSGTLPESRSFFETGSQQVVLSTMKKCEDDDNVVVRLYEADGTNGAASLSLPFAPIAMQRTNMIEEGGKPVEMAGSGRGPVPLTLQHHAVETVKFVREQGSGIRVHQND